MTCVVTTILHGAESQSLKYNVNGTEIIVQKGHISSATGKVRLMVLGRNEQKKLQAPDFGDSMRIGRSFGPHDFVMKRHKDDESASDDDTYKPFDLSANNKSYKRAEKCVMDNPVITIIEPRIFHTILYDEEENEQIIHTYCPERAVVGEEIALKREKFFKEQAIIEAKADIVLCCKKALGIEILTTDKQNRAIALDAFGSHTGVPREEVASAMASALFNYALEHCGAYKTIILFVKKRSEIAIYKKFLDAEIKKQMDELTLAMQAGDIDKFKNIFIMGENDEQ